MATEDNGSTEYALAVARSLVATASLLAAYVNLIEPARHAWICDALLVGYALFAFGVLALARRSTWLAPFALHGVDLCCAALLTFFTNGPNGIYFVFVLLAAAYRWGLKETLITGGAAFVFLIADAAFAASWPRAAGAFGQTFALNSHLMHGAYLVVLSSVFGYLAETEKQARADAETIARAHLARELHDGPIQSLAGLDLQIDELRRAPGSEALREHLADVQLRLRDQITIMRGLMMQMTPPTVTPEQLLEFLVELVDKFRRETGIAVRFFSDVDEVALPPRICREIAGIVREGLTNIRKHSGARNAQVHLTSKDGHWKLVIVDDGRGLDSVANRGGDYRPAPRVIRERALAIGGQLVVDSSPGRGVRLVVDFQRAYPWTPIPKRSAS